jgi:crotonobetainyl-CoA:carnitine CoA-transferase CaiB-like acyl-CoA transferase
MQEWVQSRFQLKAKGRADRKEKRFPLRAVQTSVTQRRQTDQAARREGDSGMTISGNDEGFLTKSFAGLRVLDFSTTIAGPHCARMLADMGAEVIKIETAEGEMMRTRPPLRNGCSTAFGQLNAGKKSLVLDLKSPDGVEVVRRLVAGADILVENFRPGVMGRLKLDYETLRALNPKLIYCSISGYGQTGPSAELPAYAPVIHAASGYDMAHLAYQPGRIRPDYCGIYHADVVTGTYAFGAIAAALYQRHATQRGQHIDVSMLESMLSLTLNELQWCQFEVKPTPRPMFGPIETADGYVMVAIASEKTFQGLMKVIGHPEWLSDPRFAKYSDRRDNWAALMDGVETWSRTVTTENCLAALNSEGVPSSAYRTVAEALGDPQIAHRRALSEVEDGGGTFKVLNLPFRMSGADVSAGKRMATLGEHTLALLKETGLSDGQIAGFSGKARAAERR